MQPQACLEATEKSIYSAFFAGAKNLGVHHHALFAGAKLWEFIITVFFAGAKLWQFIITAFFAGAKNLRVHHHGKLSRTRKCGGSSSSFQEVL